MTVIFIILTIFQTAIIIILFHFNRKSIKFARLALFYKWQVLTFKSKNKRPRISKLFILFSIIYKHLDKNWKTHILNVHPDTVLRWHREQFKNFWRRKSKGNPGRPRIPTNIVHIIKQMARENPIWGAPHIHGELLHLGINISESSVTRYLRKLFPDLRRRQNWITFLRNHAGEIIAIDFFVVYTIGFKLYYCMHFINHARRKIIHFNVTAHPTQSWICQQFREAFPYDTAPKYLIRDNDKKYGFKVKSLIKGMNIIPVKTAYKSPWQNPVAERWIGSVRRELFNHIIILNENHLRKLLKLYVKYYNEDRTHLTLYKDSPNRREILKLPIGERKLLSVPKIGGLHHRYYWKKAG
jgi:transposase InsO family protein